jgi:DNA polymerase zeta
VVQKRRLTLGQVYMGSVLMAKKRYVGFKYEHPDETEPVFDAKGIETIRRDGFPAQQKIEEVCLKSVTISALSLFGCGRG